MTLLLLAWLVAVATTVGGGVKSAVGRESGMEDIGRENICCSCSRLTSLKSPEDEDLGCALAVVRVEIRVLSRGMVELETEKERERKRERRRENSLPSTSRGVTNYIIITSDLQQHKCTNIPGSGTKFA